MQGVELATIEPGMVGIYMNSLPLAAPTKKLHLAALRGFFDRLVNRSQGMPLEDVQYLAGHSDPRTTWLYYRRQK